VVFRVVAHDAATTERIDNNGAENQLRAIAVGRKNWRFAGSLEGATRAALLYSLV
jgi:transposase